MNEAAELAAKILENIEELGVKRLLQKKPRGKLQKSLQHSPPDIGVL